MGRKRKSRDSSSESSSSSSYSDSTDSEDSRDRKIFKLKRKIRGLKRKTQKRSRRSTSENGRESPESEYTSSSVWRRRRARASKPVSKKGINRFRRIISDTESENDCEREREPARVSETLGAEPSTEANIDKNILNLLRRERQTEDFADPIQKDVALQWEDIIKAGMTEEDRVKTLEKYKVPKNCLFCEPPKLNPEVFAAINETALKRDERLGKVQSQMGKSLAALGKALSLLITSELEGGEQKLQIIEALSDGAKLLADIHHEQSLSRQNVVSFGLDKHLKEIIGNTVVDTWLFGENLSERIKNAKQIEKSGQELKPKVSPLRKRNTDPKNSRIPPRRPTSLAGSQYCKRKFYSNRRAHHPRKEQPFTKKLSERTRNRY